MKKLFTLLVFTAILALSACSSTPSLQMIDSLPETAEPVSIISFSSNSGTFTSSGLALSGEGYVVLEVRITEGSAKKLQIKDAQADSILNTISKPQTALYDSAYMVYEEDGEYVLNFVGAKNLTAYITVYFVADT